MKKQIWVARSGADFRLQAPSTKHQAPSTKHGCFLSTLRPIFLPFHLFVICLYALVPRLLPGHALPAGSCLPCPALRSSCFVPRDRSARFGEQLGTAVLQWAQLSTLLPIFLPLHLFVICTRAFSPGFHIPPSCPGSCLGTHYPRAPAFRAPLSDFPVSYLVIALRVSGNSWDSGSTMGSTLN